MKKEKAKRYYLTKMLTSYILIVFILLICAFSSFFYFTIRTKTAEIEKSSQKAMEQIGFTAKILYDQVSQVGAGLLSDLSVERFFSLSVSEPVFEYSLYNKMRTLRVSYPFIHSILLYRQESQKLLSDVYGGTLSDDSDFLREMDEAVSKHAGFAQMNLTALSTTEIKRKDGVLAFFFYPFQEMSANSSRAIVVFVKEEYFIELINSISISPINQVVLLDSSGNGILSTDPSILSDEWDLSFFQENLLSSSDESGRMRRTLDGKSYNITYSKTDILGWTFLSISNPENDLNSLQQLLVLLSFTSFLLLILGVVTTVIVTRQMYSPVESLMEQAMHIAPPSSESPAYLNEYDLIRRSLNTLSKHSRDMENQYKIAEPFLQEALIQKILTGTYSEGEWDAVRQLDLCRFPFHCVILVKLDRYFLLAGDSERRTADILTYAIENMLLEVLGKNGKSVLIIKKPGELTLLLSYRERIQGGSVEIEIQNIQSIFHENFLQTFTAVIGPEKGFSEVYQSQEAALSFLEYRFVLDNGSLITGPLVQELSAAFERRENPVVSAEGIFAKLRTEQEFLEDLSRFLTSLKQNAPGAALTELKTFLFRFQDALPLGDLMAAKEDACFALLFDVPEELESLQNVFEQLKRLADWLQVRWVQKANSKNRETVDSVKQYIVSHYSEPELSTEWIAEEMKLSPGYLRKLFRASEGTGISEFIMDTRLNAARDLLLSTSLTATAICEKIGIYSNTYFSTLFKKRFGTTPILYRQSILSAQADLESKRPGS